MLYMLLQLANFDIGHFIHFSDNFFESASVAFRNHGARDYLKVARLDVVIILKYV